MLQAFFIAAAVSIDSFSVGVAFGIKRIKVPLRSIVVLNFISVLLLGCGFFAGNFLSRFLPPRSTNLLGSFIILLIGIWYLIQGYLNHRYPRESLAEATAIATISIKSLGIAINILRDPTQIDLDISGVIDIKEAVILGFALAVDSLAVGIALSITSIAAIVLTLLIAAIMNFILLLFGIHLGKRYLGIHLGERTAVVPGIILIVMGLIRLF